MKKNKNLLIGFTIVEVLISLVIITIIILSIVLTQTNNYALSKRAKEKAFATQKSVQMMEELRAFVQGGGETDLINLDTKNDKFYKATLTTESIKVPDTYDIDPLKQEQLDDPRPNSSSSGNYTRESNWRFLRKITVRKLPTDPKSREVTVEIGYNSQKKDEFGNYSILQPALASLTSVLRTESKPNLPTEVIDTYTLALDNVPGWWANTAGLRKTYEDVVSDLSIRNPGLKFNAHYINRLSYGRDILYSPYINDTVYTKDDSNAKWAYNYSGLVYNTKNSANRSEYYYPVDLMKPDKAKLLTYDTSGYIVNNNLFNSPNSFNDLSYTLADQYNNAVRFPEEVAIHNRLKNLKPELEPTYRLLIEDMASGLGYKNAIFSNLHGELFPFAPVRNYSDAAKVPSRRQNLRVVTHPEQINYSNSNPTVRLKVYPYVMEEEKSTTNKRDIDTLSIFIPTSDIKGLTSTVNKRLGRNDFRISDTALNTIKSKISIIKINGGGADSDNNPRSTPYSRTTYLGTDSTSNFDISINPVISTGNSSLRQKKDGILIVLRNTPVIHQKIGNKGLDSNKRPYGISYIPSPLNSSLDSDGSNAKNTARWIINLDTGGTPTGGTCINPQTNFSCFNDSVMIVETRIGEKKIVGSVSKEIIDLNTGNYIDGTLSKFTGDTGPVDSNSTELTVQELKERIPNLSRTYVWLKSPNSVPITERNQFIGDPRHNPYLDVVQNKRYNWNFSGYGNNSSFSSNVDSADYPSLTGLTGPSFDNVQDDVPRMFETFREGILTSNSIYTSMTGYSYYYYGIGGEMGLDSENPQYFTLKGAMYKKSGTDTNGSNNEITGDGATVIASTDDSWVSLPWIGELYPDYMFTSWRDFGNLPTNSYSNVSATNLNTFYKAPYDTSFISISPDNNTRKIGNKRRKRLQEKGCASFFNGGSATNNFFNHISKGKEELSVLTSTNNDSLGINFSLSLGIPLNPEVFTARPFRLDTGNKPPERNSSEASSYSSIATRLSYIPYAGQTAPHNVIGEKSVFYKFKTDSSLAGSSIVRLERQTNSSGGKNRAHIVVNGLSPQGSSGTIFMTRYAVASMLYSFFMTGNYDGKDSTDNTTVQVPKIEVSDNLTLPVAYKGSSPTEGSEVKDSLVNLTWNLSWVKWDSSLESPKKYAHTYPDKWTPGYNGSTNTWDPNQPSTKIKVFCNIMFSEDGKNWKYIQSPSTSVETLGVYNDAFKIVPSASDSNGVSKLSYNWDISGLSNEKTYKFRIEAYRTEKNSSGQDVVIPTHYSYHEREFYVRR